ncbi:hypothetical protein JB92DRAFT_2810702 [Gautieria morchelliformis]|nr:hypothetical protein JB92DRAFT_2810702 [Gautieria morchelliformis]
MDATRNDLLNLLLSLDIKLPPKTKLPDTELEKRLSKALDAAQCLSRVVPSASAPEFDPSKHPRWNRPKQTAEAVRRHNLGEASKVYDSKMRGVKDPFPLFENPFMDLRQSIMHLAINWDEGRDTFVFKDQTDVSNIILRILEIREFDAKTPILVVIFRHELTSAPSPESLQWLQNSVEKGTARSIISVQATLLEQQLLLRLLKQNSVRLVSSYNPSRLDSTEEPFTLSFLIPVGPLGESEMGSFNKNDGCSVCGEVAKSKCARCVAIRYCGPVCQKEDWKAHRSTCKSLAGGTWRPLTFTSASQRVPGMSGSFLNRYTDIALEKGKFQKLKQEEDGVPNVHGGAPFIVKVQLSCRGGPDMLIYDRQRSFRVTALPGLGERGAFTDVAKVVREKGYQGLKVFCWAIRTGDSTLDVCIDQLPEWQNW